MLLLVKYLVTKQSDHKLDKKLNKSSVYLVYLAALYGNYVQIQQIWLWLSLVIDNISHTHEKYTL